MIIFKLLISKYRRKRKLTQQQLADKAGIKQPYISQLERGIVRKKSPTLKVIEWIAKALDMCPFLLLKCSINNDCNKCKYYDIKFFDSFIRNDVITDIHQNPFLIESYKRWFRVASKKFNIYMDEQLIKDLKKIAIDKDTSVSQILSELAIDYVRNEKEKRNK